MKLYEIAYPGNNGEDLVEVLTEDEIIAQYYPYWSDRMIKARPDLPRTREMCIEDWATVHWAVEISIPV
jgi:hypothetical protein